ncbi:MAG: GH116 family glycosyl hydrolase [Planctomycetota bacterium]
MKTAGYLRAFNGEYEGPHLDRVAFPLGGLGAGMICIEGTGALSHLSLRHRPDLFNEPCIFSAVRVEGTPPLARVLEGPVPSWKLYGPPESGNGAPGKTYGLPRFDSASFLARFPFAHITLRDETFPLGVNLTAWSPFIPGDADASCLPLAAIEIRFQNPADFPVNAVYSFHARNFMAIGKEGHRVTPGEKGFVLRQESLPDQPWNQGAFYAGVLDEEAALDCRWFRSGHFDPLTVVWKNIREGACLSNPEFEEGDPSPGGSLALPFRLEPGAEKTVTLLLCWFVPESDLRWGKDAEACDPGSSRKEESLPAPDRYRPWVAARFSSIEEVATYWHSEYRRLHGRTLRFTEAFYDTTLPPEIVEAVAANLPILKSPTLLRQADGRLWGFEGCSDERGCCPGSCTHVWNYAQAIPHLFPALERSLRRTEFFESQDGSGHQKFRAFLPIRPASHDFHAAADGQLGGVMKAFREWRISGDTEWLREMWPQIRSSLDYCIATWDPDRRGALVEPHHNTYDIEFWGPDGMCTSFYLGALRAAVRMGENLGEEVGGYEDLFQKGRRFLESELFDGEMFIQKIEWKDLKAGHPAEHHTSKEGYPPETLALLEREGPRYQYGDGCLSDGVLGAWMAEVCGVGEIIDPEKVTRHLQAVFRYNFRTDLFDHANPQRPTYAAGREGGLLLCTWPKGEALTLPFLYSHEVWTGIEYQVASHLILHGRIGEGLKIVRAARARYDGRVRNPFDEYECGHWYARALSSYALLQAYSGARYDRVEKTLILSPPVEGDFRCFLATATGYGTVGVKEGEPFLETVSGRIEVNRLIFHGEEREFFSLQGTT